MTMPDTCAREGPAFEHRLATRDGFFDAATFTHVLEAVERLVSTERSYLPAHKKGGTVAYSSLREKAPMLVDLYTSGTIARTIEAITGEQVEPTPLHDESSCSVLFYEKPGDHIGWHYDHNFYRGRHFTVLIPVVNRGAPGGLSTARLKTKGHDGETEISTPPNRLILFEGARVLHKVTPIAEGERRVIWSMTYCTDCRNSPLQGLARRVKDTAFFGLRALWT